MITQKIIKSTSCFLYCLCDDQIPHYNDQISHHLIHRNLVQVTRHTPETQYLISTPSRRSRAFLLQLRSRKRAEQIVSHPSLPYRRLEALTSQKRFSTKTRRLKNSLFFPWALLLIISPTTFQLNGQYCTLDTETVLLAYSVASFTAPKTNASHLHTVQSKSQFVVWKV